MGVPRIGGDCVRFIFARGRVRTGRQCPLPAAVSLGANSLDQRGVHVHGRPFLPAGCPFGAACDGQRPAASRRGALTGSPGCRQQAAPARSLRCGGRATRRRMTTPLIRCSVVVVAALALAAVVRGVDHRRPRSAEGAGAGRHGPRRPCGRLKSKMVTQ